MSTCAVVRSLIESKTTEVQTSNVRSFRLPCGAYGPRTATTVTATTTRPVGHSDNNDGHDDDEYNDIMVLMIITLKLLLLLLLRTTTPTATTTATLSLPLLSLRSLLIRQYWLYPKSLLLGRYHGGRRPSSDDSFHSPTVIPPSALDKPSIMKRYHRRRTTR